MRINMATTLHPVLLDHHWKADGTNIVRIRVTHNRKLKYIKTNITVTKKDVNKKGEIKDYDLKILVEDLMRKFRATLNGMDMFVLQDMEIDKVVDLLNESLKPDVFTLDFVDFGYRVAEKKSASNAKTYYTALNALVRFFEGRHPDISEITVRNLRAFEEYINNEKVVKVDWRKGTSRAIEKPKGTRAASLYISNIRAIYKQARIEYNDPDLGKFRIPNDPFEYYSLPKLPASKHRDLSPEVIQKMIDTRKSLTGKMRMAVDTFLISFALCGMNAADLFTAAKPKKDILYYQRMKTRNRRDDGAAMRVKIFPCIQKIMKDYADEERCFSYYTLYNNKDIFTTALNCGLRQWIAKYEQEDFTFYSARHSWGTIASSKKCKVDSKVVTIGLCHTSNSVDDIYINFDWEQLWDAQETVLKVFNWK